jgi:hypothetical protein
MFALAHRLTLLIDGIRSRKTASVPTFGMLASALANDGRSFLGDPMGRLLGGHFFACFTKFPCP